MSEMLYFNNLQAGCVDFPDPGAELCMPHACDIYTVEEGDACWSIVDAHSSTFTNSQLISWNVDISPDCDNIELLVGQQVCVSFPGDAPNVTATQPASKETPVPVLTDVADDTNTKCAQYHAVQGGDMCADLTQTFGLGLDDFYFLNPCINSTCGNLLVDRSTSVSSTEYTYISITPIEVETPTRIPNPAPTPF